MLDHNVFKKYAIKFLYNKFNLTYLVVIRQYYITNVSVYS